MVADEVRSLAMRSADAARNTAELIQGTLGKVKDGTDLVTRTNTDFAEVAASVQKGGDLVGEISASSREQAQGIEQVNRAVNEMDKVVQQNSANAEESSSSSEQMSAQAEEMKTFVKDLAALLSGRSGSTNSNKPETAGRETRYPFQKSIPALDEKTANRQGAVLPAEKVSPKDVIPLDDDDLKDF